MTTATATPAVGDKIACMICGEAVHSIELHLRDSHPELGTDRAAALETYRSKYPEAPLLSPIAQRRLDERRAAKEGVAVAAVADTGEKKFFHEVFGLGTSPAAMGSRGKPIPITIPASAPELSPTIPAIDPDYIFNVDVLKTVVMGMEMNIPTFIWGHAGTGKTSLITQIQARTRRPTLRVQHTANMEEDQVVGGWRARGGETFFELGPLAQAMKFGYTYIADEYDFGRPDVLSVYQAVLEGAPLFIKEADLPNRVIHPHKNFRMFATGNTNGQGDETGLYSGTSMQNAANFERFGIVLQMPWMEPDLEAHVVSRKANIPMDDTKKLVEFAKRVREDFEGSKMPNPISPRSLIYAGKLGIAKLNYRAGLDLAFINRLTAVDREAASQLAQRIFMKAA